MVSFLTDTVVCGFSLYHILAYFLIYSCIGWCLEVIYAAATTGQLVNRGFLNGPVCPIYGFGMIIVLFTLSPLADNLLLLYIGGVLLPSVLELEGKTYLCFGGAESQDKDDREPGVNWWKQEMPSDEEYAACEQNLEACGDQVDYVLTHDAPSRFLDFTVLASGETNQLHQFLDKILLKLTYEKWFFGCYHRDVQLSTKSRCVFCDVIPMGERRTGLFRR